MPWSAEERILVRSLTRPIAILALVALLFAQAAAGLHALKHFRVGGDSTGVPDAHSQLCLACVSFAPLASIHGGTPASFTVASVGVEEFSLPPDGVPAERRSYVAFRSRAPPR